MRNTKKIVSAIMVVIAISYIVISLWDYSGRKKEFFDDPDKITPPGRAVYSELEKGTYYIFVLSRHALLSNQVTIIDRDLIDGMEFRVRNLTDDKEIALEDITGRFTIRTGRRSGIYSVRKFRLDSRGDIELEVSGSSFESDDVKVFISSKMIPAAGGFEVFGRMFLVVLVLMVLQIVIIRILKRLGVAR